MGNVRLKIVWIYLILLVGIGLQSCKTTRITTTPTVKNIRVSHIAKAEEERSKEIESLWVKRIKGSLLFENSKYSFKANYRVIRDSVLILSIIYPMGIEGVRIYCKRDSFGFVDRINREYYYGRYDVLKKKIGYQPSFNLVQSILLNEIGTIYGETKEDLLEKNNKLVVHDSKCNVSLVEVLKDGDEMKEIEYMLEFEANHFQLVRNKMKDRKTKSTIDIVYDEFKQLGSKYFPGTITIKIENLRNPVTCRLELEKININSDFNTNFSIGQKYKKLEW